MYKSIFTLLMVLALGYSSTAQMRTNVSTFDVVPLATNGNYNGSDLKGGFWNGHFYYRNSYNAAWQSWSGIAVSNNTDTITNSYTNEFSSITGGGINGTKNYAVCYQGGTIIPEQPTDLTGFYVTNTTYTYRTIKEGSAFSKKFGGTTGNDKDWYRLKIDNYSGGIKVDSLRFYLADYQNNDNSKDYILKDWTWVDLSGFKVTDSLILSFESSDTGQFGINTPTYVAIDDINTYSPLHLLFQQWTTDFSNSEFFKNGKVWNGDIDTSGGFLAGWMYFENIYSTKWNSWSGWAVSKETDTSKSGFDAQYSAIPGRSSGYSFYGKDSGYAVSYGRSVIRLPYKKEGWSLGWGTKFFLTNNTYTYKSMKNGDAFSKKFGGILGTDPDYLKVHIYGYDYKNNLVDSTEVLLADYRTTVKTISNRWNETNGIRNFKKVVRLEFQMESTDMGQFGMNTPGYFCIDLGPEWESVKGINSKLVTVYPNPASTHITIDIQNLEEIEIFNMTGRQFISVKNSQSNKIDISALPAGIYFVKVKANEARYSARFVKL